MMMHLFFGMAWRNIWRQKRRTLLTLSAISLGLGAVIVFHNLGEGMRDRLVATATDSMVGEAQIHAIDYRRTGDPELRIEGASALLTKVRAHPRVKQAAPRLYGPVLAAIGDRSASLTLTGIDPDVEARVTNWKDKLVEGIWFEGEKQVLIGKKLADKLELELGGKLVLTSADVHSGDLNSVLVRIGGILASENGQLNSQMVIVPMALAQQLLGLDDAIHEVALRLDADIEDQAAIEGILAELNVNGVELVPWQTLMAPLLSGMELQNRYMLFTFVIMFILAALGISNTMGMSLLERIREFGMLQAVGTTPSQLGGLIVAEYGCLGLLGGIMGLIFGAGLTLILEQTGIPLSEVQVIGMVVSDSVYPTMVWSYTLAYSAVFALLVPFLALIPVRKTMRRDPAASLRFQG